MWNEKKDKTLNFWLRGGGREPCRAEGKKEIRLATINGVAPDQLPHEGGASEIKKSS